jgi:hypothetical protein
MLPPIEELFLMNMKEIGYFEPMVSYGVVRHPCWISISQRKSRSRGLKYGNTNGPTYIVRHNSHEDLYVTAYGGNRLYHNNGDGTFTDVTERSGTGGSGWSTSAAWVDLDDDGLLDLVALRYLRWDPYMTSVCKLPFPFSRAPVQSGCWIWLRRRQTAPASSGREAV